MSLSLLVSIRSTSPATGVERVTASGWTPAAALAFAGSPVTLMPRSASRVRKARAASLEGSSDRSTGPEVESSGRPSSAVRAVTGAMLGLTPIGWRTGPV